MKLISRVYYPYKINYGNGGLLNFIDIGSVGGLPKPWKSNANIIHFLLNFDPNELPKSGPNFVTCNTALWESEAMLPFYIYKGSNAMGASFFKQNYDFVRENFDNLKQRGPARLAETWFDRSSLSETRQIQCRPLYAILKESFPTTPFHFLKVDAQGAEYPILKGAQQLLKGSCIGLHLELFVLPLYEGIVLLDKVQAFLEDFGFYLAKKFPPHGSFDSQHDCVFLRKEIDSQKESYIRRIYEIDNIQ
jgi:FkbM family methyltransferase